MPSLAWYSFDANNPDPVMEQRIQSLAMKTLNAHGINGDDVGQVLSYARSQLQDYEAGGNSGLNRTVDVGTFRPHEFDSVTSNNDSLLELVTWLHQQEFEWRGGSSAVQNALKDAYASGGSTTLKGGRESVILDNLIVVRERVVAVEIETSKNWDNGLWTLRQAIRIHRADYGVMIVPWSADKEHRADEGKVLGRLDREFDGSTQLSDGPIYRVAIVRQLDVVRRMLDWQR